MPTRVGRRTLPSTPALSQPAPKRRRRRRNADSAIDDATRSAPWWRPAASAGSINTELDESPDGTFFVRPSNEVPGYFVLTHRRVA